MPSFVPRGNEPYQKRDILDKRMRSLRGLIASGASAARIADAAEKVRHAALAVIKARRSILAERPEDAARRRELDNLERDEARWRESSVEAILAEVM
jgi:hypothetical protein